MRFLYIFIPLLLFYFYNLFLPEWMKEVKFLNQSPSFYIISTILGMALNKIWSQYLEIKELKDNVETKEINEIGFKKD